MERDLTQSMLDEKFPRGANVVVVGQGYAFNTPRFIVLNDGLIRCSSYERPQELDFYPDSIEDGEEEGSVVFKNATSLGNDLLVRPAPEAIQDALVEWRNRVFTDKFIEQSLA